MNENEPAGSKYVSKHLVAEAATIREESKGILHFPFQYFSYVGICVLIII